jgi:DNA-binding MarR family transcriptional regulator
MMSSDVSSIINQLSELEMKILAHIYHYGPDTPWLLARRLLGAAGWRPIVPEDEVERAVQHLVQLGLLQEFRGSLKGRVTSSVKPWLKVKQRNPERRGRGIYYDLTKIGRKVASEVWKNYVRPKLRSDVNPKGKPYTKGQRGLA